LQEGRWISGVLVINAEGVGACLSGEDVDDVGSKHVAVENLDGALGGGSELNGG